MKTSKDLKEWVELHCASDDECDRAFDETDYSIQAEMDEDILWNL